MISLQDQVAVVTGAGRGIGRAIAVELGQLGLRVVLASRTLEELQDTARLIDGARVVPTNVRDPAAVRSLLDKTVQDLGQVDILVNAAGVYHYGLVTDATEDDFDRILETNLRGIFSACRFVIPHMTERGRGHVINIASIAGKVSSPRRALYCASKFGLVGFSHALAEEVREHGVRVSVICPGSTNTRFSPKESHGKSPEKMLQPSDVAHAVRMLLGQESNSFISEVVMRPTRKP